MAAAEQHKSLSMAIVVHVIRLCHTLMHSSDVCNVHQYTAQSCDLLCHEHAHTIVLANGMSLLACACLLARAKAHTRR